MTVDGAHMLNPLLEFELEVQFLLFFFSFLVFYPILSQHDLFVVPTILYIYFWKTNHSGTSVLLSTHNLTQWSRTITAMSMIDGYSITS